MRRDRVLKLEKGYSNCSSGRTGCSLPATSLSAAASVAAADGSTERQRQPRSSSFARIVAASDEAIGAKRFPKIAQMCSMNSKVCIGWIIAVHFIAYRTQCSEARMAPDPLEEEFAGAARRW